MDINHVRKSGAVFTFRFEVVQQKGWKPVSCYVLKISRSWQGNNQTIQIKCIVREDHVRMGNEARWDGPFA